MRHVEKHGPYDGVFGFSQGAFMAATLCNRTIWQGLFGLPACPFSFCIVSNSALSSLSTACRVVQADGKTLRPLALPVKQDVVASLHLIGARDRYRRDSEQNAEAFSDTTSYVHAEGHELPSSLMHDEALHKTLDAFFQRFSVSSGIHQAQRKPPAPLLEPQEVQRLAKAYGDEPPARLGWVGF